MAKQGEPPQPGQRVRVTQQIPQRDRVWTTQIVATVRRVERKKTGSWFAHARDDRLWLDRLVLVKDDGEIIVCHLDRYTRIEVLDPPAAPPAAADDQADEDAPSPPQPSPSEPQHASSQT